MREIDNHHRRPRQRAELQDWQSLLIGGPRASRFRGQLSNVEGPGHDFGDGGVHPPLLSERSGDRPVARVYERTPLVVLDEGSKGLKQPECRVDHFAGTFHHRRR